MDSAAPERSLARANLLRVRGQLAEAKAELLALLAARPGDRDALDLLARTCDDAGETDEARHWRGIAGRSATGAETCVPIASTPREIARYAIPIVAVVAILTLGLAWLTRGQERPIPSGTNTINGRIEAPGAASATNDPVEIAPTPQTSGTSITPTEPTTRSALPGQTSAEARGLARLGLAEGASGRALVVTHDPRTDTVTVTFSPRAGETPRHAAATLARTAFGTFLTVRTLQLRAVQRGDLVYLATSSRERLAAVETEGWARESGSNPDALADALLSDEWSAPETSTEAPDALGGSASNAPTAP